MHDSDIPELPFIAATLDQGERPTWASRPYGLSDRIIREVGEDFIRAVLDTKLTEAGVLIEKQAAYGPMNIARPPHGISPQVALAVRINDKVQRLGTLLSAGDTAPAGSESRLDTWGDVANYASIGTLVETGQWPGLDH